MAKRGGFECAECGWRTAKWVGRCGECQQWGTVVEVGARPGGIGQKTDLRSPTPDHAAKPITEVSSRLTAHQPTGIGELDRVLGGGLVQGAAILFSGEPGVGKSTLLLTAAATLAGGDKRVLYVSGEESTGQIRLRAERTGALEDALFLAAETDLSVVLGHIKEVNPDVIIIDSVQTLASDAVDGIAGGPSQVKEVATTLIRVAKERETPLFLVGHVTKDGTVAGPRVLEHLVDVVCHFEGDRHTALRFLRTLKNRFGATDEIGCFEMSGEGIVEVKDPSGLFLSGGLNGASGVCTTISLEGRRAFPVEIQALVAQSSTPNPRRVTSGVESARVAMILAVLERHLGVKLGDKDVYVSTVGGVKLSEPAADLAIALAILSSARGQTLAQPAVAFGEISLTGEIRPVLAAKQRGLEANRLGVLHVIDSAKKTLLNASRVLS